MIGCCAYRFRWLVAVMVVVLVVVLVVVVVAMVVLYSEGCVGRRMLFIQVPGALALRCVVSSYIRTYVTKREKLKNKIKINKNCPSTV